MGAVFALFAGFYYWTPKIVGRNINDFLGKIHFWTFFVGVRQMVLEGVFNKNFYLFAAELSLHNSIYEIAVEFGAEDCGPYRI